MDGCFSYEDLKGLQDLLVPPKEDSGSEDDLPQKGTNTLGEYMIYVVEKYQFILKTSNYYLTCNIIFYFLIICML